MRFLADENVEQPVIEALRAAGHDVASVADLVPGAIDQEVLRLAGTESRLLLTNDKDFGELVYREGRTTDGIVLLRFDTQDGLEKTALLTEMLPRLQAQLVGHFVVVTERRVRVRPLRGL